MIESSVQYVLCRIEDDSSPTLVSSHEDILTGVAAGGYAVEVEAAKFGRSVVDRGNKAIHVRADDRSLAADVVPCYTYRRYDGIDYYHQGIQIRPDSGGVIVNWPEQSYAKEWRRTRQRDDATSDSSAF